MKKACASIIFGALLFLSCKPRIPQSPTAGPQTPVTVSNIFVAGNRRIPTDTIKAQIRTQTGSPLNESTVKGDVERIRSLGEIRDVRVSYENAADGGRVVIFNVSETLNWLKRT